MENQEHESRVRIQRRINVAEADRQKGSVVAKKWHEMNGTKVILVQKTAAGNVYRTYVGNAKAGSDHPGVKELAAKIAQAGGKLEVQ